MDDTDLQETYGRLEAKIDALSVEMKAGFARAFEQTQGGFDDFRAFATFVRTEAAERAKQLERRIDGTNERIDRHDQRFDAIDKRFDALDRRFDRTDQRFDRLEQLIKER